MRELTDMTTSTDARITLGIGSGYTGRFVKAFVNKANLKSGSRVLDVGCGQGFFSWLFADFGSKAGWC